MLGKILVWRTALKIVLKRVQVFRFGMRNNFLPDSHVVNDFYAVTFTKEFTNCHFTFIMKFCKLSEK